MRFIANSPTMSVTAVKPKERNVTTPGGATERVTDDPGFIARFQPFRATPWELERAREKWGANISGKLAKGARFEGKVGVFDSKWVQSTWRGPDGEPMSDEYRMKIEEGLKRNPSHGLRYFSIEKPTLPAPWPNYDEITTAQGVTKAKVAQTIVETMQAIGVQPETVVAYELENEARQEVVDAVSALVPKSDVPSEAITVSA